MIELDINVLGFNQEKVLEIKNVKIEKRKNTEKEITQTLEIEDLYLLNRLFNFRGSAKTANAIIDGKVFFWINYKTLLENMPILNMTKETLMNKFKKYVDMKLIERKQIYEKDGIKGTYSYMHITEKLEDLQINKNDVMDSGCDDDMTEGVASTQQGVSYQHDRGCVVDVTTKKGIHIKGKDIKGKERERNIEMSLDEVRGKIQDIFGHSLAPQVLDSKTSKILELIKKLGLEKVLKTLDKIKNNEWLKERKRKIGDINFLNYILGLEKFTDIAHGSHDPFEEKTVITISQKELEQRLKESDDFGDLLN